MPAADEIHLWCVRNEDEDSGAHLSLLSPEELERMTRLQVPSMRQQFVTTRAAIRTVLSGCFPGVAPRDWDFARNPWGRPMLVNAQAKGRVSFNIAHTNGLIVIALSGSGEVGVDVEKSARAARALALAERYFSASEAVALRTLPAAEQQKRFLDLWTLKEAYIKACGKGLAIPLRQFSFILDEAPLRIVFDEQRPDEPSRWQFWQLQVGRAHLVGLALADAGVSEVRMSCRSLQNLQPGPAEEVRIIRQSVGAQDRMYSRTNLEP